MAGIAIAPPTLEGWHDVALAAEMQARLHLPVRIENDANAAALGEWRFGAGRGTEHMVFVTVSTGIGGGVIADGRLLQGNRGLAAEIGHMTVDATATESLFGGAPGAWEALASGTALGRDATRGAQARMAPACGPWPDPGPSRRGTSSRRRASAIRSHARCSTGKRVCSASASPTCCISTRRSGSSWAGVWRPVST